LNYFPFENFEIIIPQSKEEQTAIANILSDMDSEINTITAKLNKLRSIKQGMMDELLTGRIRLIAAKPVIYKKQNIKITQEKPVNKSIENTTRHNQAIEDAVILAAITDLYANPQYYLAPFYAQKFPYLLQRYIKGAVKGYHKLPAGPYNPELKYRTALPIAIKNKYIISRKATYMGTVYDELFIGEKIEEAKSYFKQWYGSEPLKWLEQFRYIKNRKDELELLTTVDMAMVELRQNSGVVSVKSIKEIIQNNKKWKKKLKRELFSDNNIDRAIKWSNDLFGQGDTDNGEN